MRKVTNLILVSALLLPTGGALACDESCQRDQVKAKHNIEFPSHLSWKYCEGLRQDFISIDMRSLQSYGSSHFDTRYKGPIKNIVQLIDQRQTWLSECDQYMSLTTGDHIFNDEKTTKAIFANMDEVKKELQGIINGVRYSSATGDETQKIVREKFDHLYQIVDNHNNLMHLRGKYVYQ